MKFKNYGFKIVIGHEAPANTELSICIPEHLVYNEQCDMLDSSF